MRQAHGNASYNYHCHKRFCIMPITCNTRLHVIESLVETPARESSKRHGIAPAHLFLNLD